MTKHAVLVMLRAARWHAVACACFVGWSVAAAYGLTPNHPRVDRIRPVAVSRIEAPGLPGVQFHEFTPVSVANDLNAPAINDRGQTVFFAGLSGAGVTAENDWSLWMDDRGDLKLLAREGDAPPGASTGAQFDEIRSGFPAIGNDGTVVFAARARTSREQADTGLWRYRDGELSLLALENASFPSSPGYLVDAVISEFRVNNRGQVTTWLKKANPRSGSTTQGLYLFQPDKAIDTVVETGQAAPQIGDLFTIIAQRDFALNDAGDSAFVAFTAASGLGERRDSGVWKFDSKGLQLLAREGDQAPGVPPDTVFRDINQGTPFGAPLSINQQGSVTFLAQLTGSHLTLLNGAWTVEAGEIDRRFVEYEDTIAGIRSLTIGSVEYGNAKPPISMNDAGELALLATLAGAVTAETDRAILRDRGNGLEIVARAGDEAPGAPRGSVFYDFPMLPSGVGLNTRGQIAFRALYNDPATSTIDSGIWVADEDQLRLIVRTGDVLKVSPGDARIVDRVSFLPGSGNADGQRSGFDNLGRVAFNVDFTDGSGGMFVSTLTAVPEPAISALAAIAATLQLLGRRPRRPAAAK